MEFLSLERPSRKNGKNLEIKNLKSDLFREWTHSLCASSRKVLPSCVHESFVYATRLIHVWHTTTLLFTRILQRGTHCKTLQYTTTNCNTLQHTATHLLSSLHASSERLCHQVSMPHPYMWHDSFMCDMTLYMSPLERQSHQVSMTHPCRWHDSFIYVTWLIDVL